MGGEFHAISLRMHICRTRNNFHKQYWKVEIDEQVYMALKIIRQTSNKKVEVYYERILKLVNYLKHKTNGSLLMTFF